MKKIGLLFSMIGAVVLMGVSSCGGDNSPAEKHEKEMKLKEESVNYDADTSKQIGFVAYNEAGEKLPVILIVPEWWGLNDYAKNRAKQLAELGYFAFAVDMYGEGKIASNPTDAAAYATPFYSDPAMANARIQAAIDKIKSSYPQADTKKIVAIGYCFGGSMVLNAAKSGFPFVGTVSFHGGLAGVKPEKGKIKGDILVCHGGADQFVPATDVTKFKAELDSVGAHYTFKTYANATHAFTNPDATANGKKFNMPISYNKKADEDSWKDFMAFLEKVLK